MSRHPEARKPEFRRRPVRPVDAAALVLVRHRESEGGTPEILLGRRSMRARFMPGVYVMPGGRVDREDMLEHVLPCQLRHDVEERLVRTVTRARAHALARAAVRESYEETGLLAGRMRDDCAPPPTGRTEIADAFAHHGIHPCFEDLDYVARAITPPTNPRRFDTRFFMLRDPPLLGRIRSNGELEDLHWRPLSATPELRMAGVTRFVLEQVRKIVASGPGPQPRHQTLCAYSRAGIRRLTFQ